MPDRAGGGDVESFEQVPIRLIAPAHGESSLARMVTTNAAGVARFQVPLHAAFSPTTGKPRPTITERRAR